MLVARNVHKRYAAREVLRGVSLSVAAGEVFGFVGPNGAGKTTFLKALVGVVRPDAGDVRIQEVDALRDPLAARRLVGYAPGDAALYDGLRVGELLRFAVGFHPDADLALGEELLERFALPPRMKVRHLSHGMRRKLLVAQALASGAPLLVLDEPMEGLDPEARHRVEEMLREAAGRGRAVLFSSHDLVSVERVADRVAFLRDGAVVAEGAVGDVLAEVSRVLWLRLRVPLGADDLPRAEGLDWEPAEPLVEGKARRWRLLFRGELEDVLPTLASLPLLGIRDASGGLDEAFSILYREADEEGATRC